MITVHTSPNIIEVYKAKSILDDEGIKCTINNESVSFLAGEVPFAATWPQLDILNESDYEKAKKALELLKLPDRSHEQKWECPGCSEVHEAQFERCWSCDHEKVG